ncbi:MAG: imidazole glycerol phosphate synthase subunit HisH [Akkermansia sp.]|nr:imidazole glycerol phosphate synthase subunit HisH [Akkermansia sp.]
MNKPGIIDYGAGNLASVCNSFRAIGVEGKLVRTPADITDITHLVLPGVGAFGDCAVALRKQNLANSICEWISQDKPFLGICIGYQILFDSSEETPGAQGLGIFKGHVRRFADKGQKIPHMGWNAVTPLHADTPIWAGMGESPYFYYVHSYYPEPQDKTLVAATSSYGDTFAAAIVKGRVIATQFHPEKSQIQGLRLLKNFLTL